MRKQRQQKSRESLTPPKAVGEMTQAETIKWKSIGYGGEAEASRAQVSQLDGPGGVLKAEVPVSAVKMHNPRGGKDKAVNIHLEAVKRADKLANASSLEKYRTLFFKHLTIRLLDNFFIEEGSYTVPHVTTPLGYSDEGYYYKYAPGSDSFMWQITDYNREWGPSSVPIQLAEWHEFTGAFNETGIDVGHDITDSDDSRVSKNVVLDIEHYPDQCNQFRGDPDLPKYWRRIDFGSSSLPANYEKLRRYIRKNEDELKGKLGDTFELLDLASRAGFGIRSLSNEDTQTLEDLSKEYRAAVLGGCWAFIGKKAYSEDPEGMVTPVWKGETPIIKGVGGYMRAPEGLKVVRRRDYLDHAGTEDFYRHLSLRLLDQMFIREGKYDYSHLTRPLGHFSEGYFHEFAEGSVVRFRWDKRQPDEWNEFVGSFKEVGVDLEKNSRGPGGLSRNIVYEDVGAGEKLPSGPISNRWKRIDLSPERAQIDPARVRRLIKTSNTRISQGMGDNAELFKLAAKTGILKEELDPDEKETLYRLATKYRRKTLGYPTG